MNKKPKRYFLREKEAKKFLRSFSLRVKLDSNQLFGLKPRIEVEKTKATEIYFINGRPLVVRAGDILFPTLAFEEIFSMLPRIVVDMGAVPHVCNGADVMAPGLVDVDGDFDKSDLILIVDEDHGKPLAIGTALLNSQIIRKTKHGKIGKNLHHVGDILWIELKR